MVTHTDDCEQLGVEAAAASDAGTAKDGESFDVGAETVDGEDLDGPATGGGDEGAEGGGSGEGGGGGDEGGDGEKVTASRGLVQREVLAPPRAE